MDAKSLTFRGVLKFITTQGHFLKPHLSLQHSSFLAGPEFRCSLRSLKFIPLPSLPDGERYLDSDP